MRCVNRPRTTNFATKAMHNDSLGIQKLWALAQSTFNEDAPPTAKQVEALRLAVASLPLHELGIDARSSPRNNAPRGPGASSKITYLHIQEDARVSLGIFCLPAGTHIPLHDHPGMTVLSRVLYGSMHVKSFDWSDRAAWEAVPVLDRTVVAGDEPLALFPDAGGNIHAFTAVTDCAVLDLLSPPYRASEGRDCTYYRECGPMDGRTRVRLEVYEPPDDFAIGKRGGESDAIRYATWYVGCVHASL
jgi:plant cysteine oxidase